MCVCVGGGGGGWGAGGAGEGGARGFKLIAGCMQIGAPAPKLVPNNYISRIEN